MSLCKEGRKKIEKNGGGEGEGEGEERGGGRGRRRKRILGGREEVGREREGRGEKERETGRKR